MTDPQDGVPTPQEVLDRESSKEWPWSSLFGCAELETVAKAIVEYLVETQGCWDSRIPEAVIRERLHNAAFPVDWLMRHWHVPDTECSYEELVSGERLTPWFRERVLTRP